MGAPSPVFAHTGVLFAQRLRCVLTVFVAAFLLWPIAARAQQQDSDDIAQGIRLLARLSPHASDSAADRAIFNQVGIEHAEKMLLAVATHGMSPDATTDDWAAMHRAYDALIELYAGEQQFLKAGIFAGLQDFAYGHDEGDYNSALAAARQALALQQRSGQTQTISIPWVNLANDLIHLGHIDEGADALYKAREFVQDPTSPLAVDIRTRIISLDSSRGNSAAAHAEAERFLQSAGSATPVPYRAGALLAAANLDIDDQHYDEAIARVHQALGLLKGAKDAELTGYRALNVLMTIGLKAMENMPLDQALGLCKRLDKDFPGLPFSITGYFHQVANHRRRLAGQFDLVLRDDAAALGSARKAGDVPGQVSALLSTAVDYSYLRDSDEQEAALQQAFDLLQTAAADRVVPNLRFEIYESLAETQLARGDLRAARATYTKVLTGIEAIPSAQVRGQLAGIYGDAKLGMASLLQRDGDLDGARALLDQALHPTAGSLGRFTASSVLLQRAKLEQSARGGRLDSTQPDEVARLYLAAIDALHKEKDPGNEVYARLELVRYLADGSTTAPGSQGHDASKAGESADALARRQLGLAEVASNTVVLADATWRVHFLRGILEENAGHRTAAVRSYTSAIDALDRLRAGLSQEEERRSFIDSASVQELYRRQVQLLTAMNDREQAWEYLERDKARSFLESLHGRRFAAPAGAGTSDSASAAQLAKLERQIVSVRLSLLPENESMLRASGRSTDALHAKLIDLENQFALARQQSALNDSRATEPLTLRPIPLAAVEKRLPPRTALLEYAILDHELAAFVVTHDSARELHWKADSKALSRAVVRAKARLSSAPRGGAGPELAVLSETLLAPVMGLIPPRTDTLIIVPAEELALVPWSALPIPLKGAGRLEPHNRSGGGREAKEGREPEPVLIDRYSIASLPSASTLEFLHFGAPAASPDVFLGAIGDVAVENLPPLPGTLAETAAIQKLYPEATRLTGPAFTHQAAVNALIHYPEVHFATHGLFEEQAPLFSSLVTAPAAGQPTRLSLYELTDLHLKARLVILSACETDRARLTGGDEASSLTRTFLQAGAETVVSSLWKVNDASTAMLMTALHRHLRAGELTPDALRHAELEVRRKFPQPYYWAAFVDTGIR